ncbi:MAG: hypothetical protein WC370_05600 [Dehalococcoidales bacterium]
MSHGMNLRFAFPPYPVGWLPRSVLHDYVEGNDPITGLPLMQEVIDGLTQPLKEDEIHPVMLKRPRWSRLLSPDTEANLQRLFLEKGWTDGLPVILPTEERVAEMLTGTDHAPDEVLGQMTVTTHQERLEYNVEKVAVNAVMAGARPEHFPVILALAATQQPSLPSSTTSFGSMAVVNGPVRKKIGMNSTAGALSPFNFANSVIGRAWTLLSINFGEAKLAENFTASTGNNVNYNNMCCAENEETSPWQPFHVQKGFKASESTVSVFRGWSVIGFGTGQPKQMASIMTAFNSILDMFSSFTFVMDPLVAKNFKREGFQTKQQLAKWLEEQANVKILKAENINFLVVGGEWNPMYLTTDFSHVRTISVDKWIPKTGIKYDDIPIRMPVAVTCKDGVCGLPGADMPLDETETAQTH